MGVIPATGSEISMGKVHVALGLSPSYPPPSGTNTKLNATLGAQISISAGAETKLSEDFGGLTTPSNYP